MPVRRLAALGALTVLLATACTNQAPRAPSATTTPSFGKPVAESPTLPELTISSEPIWGSDNLPQFGFIQTVRFRGTTAIITGAAEHNTGKDSIAAVDAGTGKVIWSIDAHDDLLGGGGAVLWSTDAIVAGDDSNFVVVVEYFLSECTAESGLCPPGSAKNTDEQGLAGLSGKDGSVLWKAVGTKAVPVDSPQAGQMQELSVALVAGDDTTALMVIAPSAALNGGQFTAPDAIRTIAVAPATGKRKWTATGSWPRKVAGDTLVASVPSQGPKGQVSSKLGTVVGLDLATGAQRWSLANSLPNSEVKVATPDAAVVFSIKDAKISSYLIKVADGTQILELDPSVDHNSCITDDIALIACLVQRGDPSGDRLMTYTAGQIQPLLSGEPVQTNGLNFAHGGYVVLGGNLAGEKYIAVDRSGNERSDQFPGRVVTLTDKYAVFDPDPSSLAKTGTFVVHRVTS